MTDISQSLYNLREIYHQFTADTENISLLNKRRKSSQFFHDELYDNMYDIEAWKYSILFNINLSLGIFSFFSYFASLLKLCPFLYLVHSKSYRITLGIRNEVRVII